MFQIRYQILVQVPVREAPTYQELATYVKHALHLSVRLQLSENVGFTRLPVCLTQQLKIISKPIQFSTTGTSK